MLRRKVMPSPRGDADSLSATRPLAAGVVLLDRERAVFTAGHGASAMLSDTFASGLASLSVAAYLGVGNPSGEGCFGGGQVDQRRLAGSQVHRAGGAKFGAEQACRDGHYRQGFLVQLSG